MRKNGPVVVGRVGRIIIRIIVINTKGLVLSIKNTTIHTALPSPRIVIHNEGKIAFSIIRKVVYLESGPSARRQGDHTAEHLVVLGNRNPIGAVGKRLFVGMDKVHVQIAGLIRAVVVKVYAINIAGSPDFSRGVYLLSQRVAII